MPIFSAPLEALAAFGFIGAGVPVFFITQRRHGGNAGRGEGRRSGTLGKLLSSCFGGRGQRQVASERRSEGEMAERESGTGQSLLTSNSVGFKSGANEEILEMTPRS